MVISIISLLSSIVLAALNDARAKGRDTARIRAMIETRTALQLYFNDNNGKYPNNTSTSLSTILANQIPSIHSEILYKGIQSNGALCSHPLHTCTSYHMAVKLELSNNALTSDADFNPSGNSALSPYDGVSSLSSCGLNGTTDSLTADLCDDLIP